MIAVNKDVDSSKREDSKIRRINTRSAIVVNLYNLIELRDILSRLVVVVIDALSNHLDDCVKLVAKMNRISNILLCT
jgi:hypothetical protein